MFATSESFDLTFMSTGDFLYADPPYLISCGSYNDGKRGFAGWRTRRPATLQKLDDLNERGISFALSNVIEHKGMNNETLARWANRYNINYLKADYSNSTIRLRLAKQKEVLITNY